MNILIAMDSLKGSLSSLEANKAIMEGLTKVSPDWKFQAVPVADGGEGTVEALVYATNGQFIDTEVTGPLGEPVQARYGILGDRKTAVIEVAEACGLPLVSKEKRNPLLTTTYGVGEMILEAIDKGCQEFIIGLGGSATTDAGIGMLQALGYQFSDKNGLSVGFGGAQLKRISKVDVRLVPDSVKAVKFRIACDVNNPLYGLNGAAYIYGPQKGATPEMVKELDSGLRHFAGIVLDELGMDLQELSGAGAAGGLGAAFAGFLNSQLESGVEMVLEGTKLAEKLQRVDLVITGEGKLDGQTSMGKAPSGIARMAAQLNIPVIALAGDISEGNASLHETGITAYFTIVSGPTALEEAMKPEVTRANLRRVGEQIGRVWRRDAGTGPVSHRS